MNNKEKKELFVKMFGEEPTNSKTDQFFMDYLAGLNKRDDSRKKRRNYKAATIEVVVNHYSKSA